MSNKQEAPAVEQEPPVFTKLETSNAQSLDTNLAAPADFTKVLEFLVNFGGPWHLSRSGTGFPEAR